MTALDGGGWRVRRLWAPRLRGESLWGRARQRTRGAFRRSGDVADAADVPSGCLDSLFDDLAGAIVGVAFLAVAALVLLVGLPLLLALADVVVVVVLTVLGIVARVVFRRPWVVEAVGGGGVRHTWRVAGWRASGVAVDDIAAALAHGQPLPPGGVAAAARRRSATGPPADT